jgi:hypothetical protein
MEASELRTADEHEARTSLVERTKKIATREGWSDAYTRQQVECVLASSVPSYLTDLQGIVRELRWRGCQDKQHLLATRGWVKVDPPRSEHEASRRSGSDDLMRAIEKAGRALAKARADGVYKEPQVDRYYVREWCAYIREWCENGI